MIQELLKFLSDVPAGKIQTSISRELFNLVAASWDEFSGSGETSMAAWKISRDEGPEEATWKPPCLSFVILRHGAAALGSSRAERQQWTLNLERRTADHLKIGTRQIHPNAPKLDVKGLADNVCKAVQEGPESASRLVSDGIIVWKSENELMVYHGKIVGGASQQTITSRRKRFRDDLNIKMKVIGWEFVSRNRGMTFKKMESSVNKPI